MFFMIFITNLSCELTELTKNTEFVRRDQHFMNSEHRNRHNLTFVCVW